MAQTHHMEPRGSWILRIVIAILFVVLIASILYPKQLWDRQEEVIELSRERMDNLNAVVQRHKVVTGKYIDDPDSLLRFIRQDTITVSRPALEIDKMSLYDAGYDSFVVDMPDRFHFDDLSVTTFSGGREQQVGENDSTAQVDSLILTMVPKEEFADVVSPVRYGMASGGNMYYYRPQRGAESVTLVVWSDSLIRRDYLPFEERRVPSERYLLNMPVDEIAIDPITGEPFQLSLNTRLDVSGKITYTAVKKGPPSPAVAGNELYSNIFLNQLAKSARTRLEADLQRDTTLYGRQIEMQGEYFDLELDLVSPSKPIEVESHAEIRTPADSVTFFTGDTTKLRQMLYVVAWDSLLRIWSNLDKTQTVLSTLTYQEQINVTKIDTVGVSIRPPFEKSHNLPAESLLDKIFAVGPVDHPGQIIDNDLSWSEKR